MKRSGSMLVVAAAAAAAATAASCDSGSSQISFSSPQVLTSHYIKLHGVVWIT